MGVANTECYSYKDINYYLLKKIVSFIIVLDYPWARGPLGQIKSKFWIACK